MSDEFTLYERGISHLLNALQTKSSQQFHQDILLVQFRLARNITRARIYGPEPSQDAELNKILEQLIELSLLVTGKSFYEWCQTPVSLKQEASDLSDMRREGFSQELLDTFIELGARPFKGQSLAHEDMLERYVSVPLHAVFLYTSEDKAVSSYILDNWGALDALSGSICDIHPILEQFQNANDAYNYVQQLDIVQKASFNTLSQLPGLFFWNHTGETAYLSFGAETKSTHITNVLRVVFEELRRDPTPGLVSVNRAKQILGQAQHLSDQQSSMYRPFLQEQNGVKHINRADIGIIIALPEEFDVFFPTIARRQQAESDPQSGSSFYCFDAPTKVNPAQPYRCVASLLGRMGPMSAILATQRMMDLYQPLTYVVLGIAAGIHPDVCLGDVIIADSVDSYIDRGKLAGKDDSGAFSLSLSGQVYQCSADLLHRLHAFKYHNSRIYRQWHQASARFWKKNPMEETPLQRLVQTGTLRLPVTYTIGPLASGPLVLASSSFKELLLRRNRSLLGVEMETGGILAALNQDLKQKRSLVLRGISDYGDERKAELDKIQQGILRQFAMHNTVQLFWKLLEAGIFQQNL